MAHVTKIVVNPSTDGIILILSNGDAIAHTYWLWCDDIKRHFAGEVDGSHGIQDYTNLPVSLYEGEVNHPDARIVYEKEKGWLI